MKERIIDFGGINTTIERTSSKKVVHFSFWITINKFFIYGMWLLIFFVSVVCQLFSPPTFITNFLNLPLIILIFLFLRKEFVLAVLLALSWGFFLDSVSNFIFGIYSVSFILVLISGWLTFDFLKFKSFFSRLLLGIIMILVYFLVLTIGLLINNLISGQGFVNFFVWQAEVFLRNFLLNGLVYFLILYISENARIFCQKKQSFS